VEDTETCTGLAYTLEHSLESSVVVPALVQVELQHHYNKLSTK